jgi:H+-translocating NAD(P) transhydrogenase subunit alpha
MTNETQTIQTAPQAVDPQNAAELATEARSLADRLADYAMSATQASTDAIMNSGGGDGDGFFMMGLTIFVLACFVGYYVVWKVTPALHSPLMGITNAISSVIIVGAILAAGPADGGFAKFLGFLAITLASVNIFGGFIITRRMLSMFKKKGA